MSAAIPAYRSRLPQLDREVFLTDGGLETTLIFHEGIDLPLFAAFGLPGSADGRAALRKYFDTYARLAVKQGVGIVLESATALLRAEAAVLVRGLWTRMTAHLSTT